MALPFFLYLFRYKIFTDDILPTFNQRSERGFRYFNSRFDVAATVAAVVFILDVFCVSFKRSIYFFDEFAWILTVCVFFLAWIFFHFRLFHG